MERKHENSQNKDKTKQENNEKKCNKKKDEE